MQDIQQNILDEKNKPSGSVNIQKLIGIVLVHLPLFISSIIGCLLIALLYLRYATPVYYISADILIKDDQKSSSPEQQKLEDLGISTSKSIVDNEIAIIKSRTLMVRVVKDLNLYIRYSSKGRVTSIENYKNMPFQFNFYTDLDSLVPAAYKFKLKNAHSYTLKRGKLEWSANIGDTINVTSGKLVVTLPTNILPTDTGVLYTVSVSNLASTADAYRAALTLSLQNKQSSAINLVLKDNIPGRGEDVLNKLIEVYLQSNLEDKNRTADSTIAFVNSRLDLVGQELSGIENKIVTFKKENQLADIEEQSKILLGSNSDFNKQLTELKVQLEVVESLEKYMRENAKKNTILPASALIQDPDANLNIAAYNQIELQKERILMSSTENNPLVKTLEEQLDRIRRDLNNSLKTLKNNLHSSINSLTSRSGNLNAQIRDIPLKQRIYLDYNREQEIKQELYLFLLKKREETAINKSSTIANARIIDPAKSAPAPFTPKREQVFLAALIIGILIPSTYVYMRSLLNVRVNDKNDISDQTNVAIIGEIGHNDGNEAIIVKGDSRTALSEQFRTLRTNLQFTLPNKEDKVIMLTSSMSGEGKSFIAINLASTLALSGNKVALVELDLRKPKISKILNIDSTQGFSSYAINKTSYEQILQASSNLSNLYILSSGPVPPNPVELILQETTANLFKKLREDFDYIVVDTAPIGLVTDAQLISSFADCVLYIVRQGYTYKPQIQIVDDLYKNRKMPKLNILVNDVKVQKAYGYTYGYGYGYGYGYSYGYGYGNESYFDKEKNKRKKGKIFRK